MAKGSKEIRRRIRSVRSTQQITKAMKMVAAARLRKSEERARASRPYTDTLQEVMRRLGSEASELDHAFLEHIAPDNPRILVLLLSAERGLCGSFNTNLMRHADHFIAAERKRGRQVTLICAGKKGYDWARKVGLEIDAHYPGFTHKTTFAEMNEITTLLTDAYLRKDVSEVYLVFAKFVNVIKSIPTTIRLLPIESLPQGEEAPAHYRHEYVLEPDPLELLELLLPRYFRTVLFQAAIENFTSENGARMVAMDQATTAADDMISSLTLQYNKARQAGITLELLDIVGGAEALKG